MFSDWYGRKIIVVSSNFGLLVCGLMIAVAPNAATFIIFKFLIGGFQQNYSWRLLQTVLSLVSLSAIIQWWYMDESLRWLMANRKTEEARKVIKRIARVNKTDNKILEEMQSLATQVTNAASKGASTPSQACDIEGSHRLSIIDLFRVWRLLLNSLCMWFAWYVTGLSFFTIYLTATSLSGNPYLNFGLTALMELPPNIFFVFTLNRIGRKPSLRIVFSVLGIGVSMAGVFKWLEQGQALNSQLLSLSYEGWVQ
ncbi:organic cation transporter-like protein [Plakobranchus ocellatus]|uniref:Organic cation transporter-like protein n=1 Tax=Plakobranchus ocellatus TaxID=259542 RepID=A0AAV3ZBG6_9GAST|nr:organic cation transporter-like protein [Plakobranchus ocellatus]